MILDEPTAHLDPGMHIGWDAIPICEAQLVWLAMDRGESKEAADHLKLALSTIDA